jgi:hypothetical protein
LLEPQLDGGIDARRMLAGSARSGTAQLTLPRAQTAEEARPRAHPSEPRVELEDFERIEDYLRAYLESERFRSTHPIACGRWIVAWEMLWCADSRAKVLALGQRARDAMQAFSASMLELCTPLAMDSRWPELLAEGSRRSDPLDGLISVTETYRQQLGEERYGLLCGLLESWVALHETLRSHEQASQQADRRLRWEDGRRLVLLTALVMVETDRSFA